MFANGFVKMLGKDMWQKVRFLRLKQRFTLKSWRQNAEKYFGKQQLAGVQGTAP